MSKYEVREYGRRDSGAFKPSLGDDNRLSGQAAPFNSPALIGGVFREQIAPTAFNKTVRDGDMVLLDNHDSAKPLARKSAGTLQLNTDAHGLQWSAQPADTSYALDVVKNVRAGNYGGCSFSFEVTKNGDRWDEDTPDGIPMRTLTEVKVREISIVTFPAYGDTSVANREMVELAFERRDAYFERAAADAAPKPYGDVKYADPKNGKYPIDTAAHAKAAWAFINEAQNAAKYPLNGVTLADVKAAIKAAAEHFGINIASDGTSGGREVMSYEEWRAWHNSRVDARSRLNPWDDPARPTRELDEDETEMLLARHAANMRKHARELKRHMGEAHVPLAHERRAIAERHGLLVATRKPDWEDMPDSRGRGWR